MSQEWIEFIISIAPMVLSDLDYIFSMLLVVIVAPTAACEGYGERK